MSQGLIGGVIHRLDPLLPNTCFSLLACVTGLSPSRPKEGVGV